MRKRIAARRPCPASGLLLAVLCAASFSLAQQVTIAVVKSKDIVPYNEALTGFKQALEQGGVAASFVEHNLEKKKGRDILNATRTQRPDLILAIGTQPTRLLMEGISDIPIVFSMVLNPVSEGIASSMNSSGRNLTGVSLDIPLRTQFQNLKQVIPEAGKVGVLYDPNQTGAIVAAGTGAARSQGLKLIPRAVGNEADVPDAVNGIVGDIDVLWMVADPTVVSSQSTKYILTRCLQAGVPVMGLSGSYVKAGALLALSADYRDVGRQSGEKAVRILGGVPACDLAIGVPRRVRLCLNLTVAEHLGIVVPEGVVEQAAEVVER